MDTSHPFTSYTDESDNTPKWERSWHNDPKHNTPEIPSKADTTREYREWLSTPTIPAFTPDEIEALESLEGEKSDETLRKELFKEEADKRVSRFFIGQTGWVWFVHFIVDMPEQFDETMPNASKTLLRSKDGMTTLHMTSLFMSEEKAWERIYEGIRDVTSYDDEALTHVVELDKI